MQMKAQWFLEIAEALSISNIKANNRIFEWSKLYPLCVSLPLAKLRKHYPEFDYDFPKLKDRITCTRIFKTVTAEGSYLNFFFDLDYVFRICQTCVSIFDCKEKKIIEDVCHPYTVVIIGVLDDTSNPSELHRFSCISLMNYEERWYLFRCQLAKVQKIIITLRESVSFE
jgi:hypothetical protein